MKYKKSCSNCGEVCLFEECFKDDLEVCDHWDLSLDVFISIVKENKDNELVKDFKSSLYSNYIWKDVIKEFFD